MKIGILGGTFDPPHNGHLSLAQFAMRELQLDEVIFLPANRNPMKSGKIQAPAKHRLGMIDRLIQTQPGMSYSDMEITRGGPSYAVDTLAELQMVRPAEYWFLMGVDALRGIGGWKSPSRLMKLCRIAVAVRPPHIVHDVLARLPEEFRGKVDILEMPPMEISSTDIRDRMHRGQNVSPWMSAEVLQYIQANRLYQNA
ncbi:MAG: nicotinate-nucleotide adenylyltransferase [Fimbriimonas sp.]|nr:nicotinate-nucleotide adenylyltransferase [Fimbriimonas sp.]